MHGLRDISVAISKLAWNALQFKANLSQVAGPVGIVSLVGEASSFGLTALLMFTALISLNLAIINVLPFPALDGGRLLFVIIEGIKGSPINSSYVHVLNTIGFSLLILLLAAVTWHDIARIMM
jgi:regulator of sigma E protease